MNETINKVVSGTLKTVSLDDLKPDPNQPRQEFPEKEMQQLIDSINDRGIMSPITVEPKTGRNKYIIVDGERRWRAAKKLGMKSVPTNVLKRKLSDSERNVVRFHLQENHKQWSYFERAEAVRDIQKRLGITNTKDLARALGVSNKTASNYVAMLEFPRVERDLAIKWNVPFSVALTINYMQSLMPKELIKKHPDYLKKSLRKFKDGVVKTEKEFRIINRLLRNGEHKLVDKFLSKDNFTAVQAEMESEFLVERQLESVVNRANRIYKDVLILRKNHAEFDDVSRAVFTKLRDALQGF